VVPYKRTGPVCLYQKAQVQDDMQSATRVSSVEQLLESADHLIERHRADPGSLDRVVETPPSSLPEGWILYSAHRDYGGDHNGWNVELMDTSRPYQEDSIIAARHDYSLDEALRQAGHQILATTRRG